MFLVLQLLFLEHWPETTKGYAIIPVQYYIIGTLRSRTGERTTARQRTVRTGPRSPSHAMDKWVKIVTDGDAILLPEYFGHFGLFYSMLNISYRGLGSVFFLHLGYWGRQNMT